MNTADVLREAAAVIEERGWCQGEMRSDDGRVCAMEAISVAACGCSFAVILATDQALSSYVDEMKVHVWNDDPLRTEEQVTKTLRACADSLESDER